MSENVIWKYKYWFFEKRSKCYAKLKCLLQYRIAESTV